MYLEGIETNRTRLWILNSLLELVGQKDYNSITIDMIVDRAQLGRRTFYRYFKTKDDAMKYTMQLLMNIFAEEIMKSQASGIEQVTIVYFEFWERYIDILLRLKKARVLYFIEDNLADLIMDVAGKVKHIPHDSADRYSDTAHDKYYYEFFIKLAGYWKATTIWCEEYPRKSPKEMAEILTQLFR